MILEPTEFHSKRRFAATLALAGLLVSASPAAPQPKAQEGATITPNYKDADLSQIIQAVAK